MQIRPEPQRITESAQPAPPPADQAAGWGGGLRRGPPASLPSRSSQNPSCDLDYFNIKTDQDKAESLAGNLLPELTFSDALFRVSQSLSRHSRKGKVTTNKRRAGVLPFLCEAEKGHFERTCWKRTIWNLAIWKFIPEPPLPTSLLFQGVIDTQCRLAGWDSHAYVNYPCTRSKHLIFSC